MRENHAHGDGVNLSLSGAYVLLDDPITVRFPQLVSGGE